MRGPWARSPGVFYQERFVSEVGGGQGSFLGGGSIFTDFHFVGFP